MARGRSLRDAGRRYQRSEAGRARHALRQARYRARQAAATPLDQRTGEVAVGRDVELHTSVEVHPIGASLAEPESGQGPVTSPATPVLQVASEATLRLAPSPIRACRFCGAVTIWHSHLGRSKRRTRRTRHARAGPK
jgi:hypothetical protein